MSAYLIFFFIFCFSSLANAASIVFVHLGKSIPSCIFTSMKQARHLNPDVKIYLLSDATAYNLLNQYHASFFQDEKIDLINTDEIPQTLEHLRFNQIHLFDRNLVDGYWMYASERFFTLYDFISSEKIVDILHLESDCMLYVDIEEILPILESLSAKLAAPFQSLKGCIPCLVFIKDSQSLHSLVTHMLSEIENFKGKKPHLEINDMQTLASFYRKFKSPAMIPLPTLMTKYARYQMKRKSVFAADNNTPLSFLSLHANHFFNYLFDAAGLGIFINGNDRRFSPSHGPGTVHSRSLFDPRFFSFFWGKDIKGNPVPYLFFQGEAYRIVNLHFHSKKPEDYSSFCRDLAPFPFKG